MEKRNIILAVILIILISSVYGCDVSEYEACVISEMGQAGKINYCYHPKLSYVENHVMCNHPYDPYHVKIGADIINRCKR